MANSGVGNKFVSVNLNKSYGQQPSKHHYHSHHSGSYGLNRAARHGAGGGGGGGMVVLSRPRSSQKAGPKLSVPPPLNLPSLRKENERFDSLGPGSVPAGGGISGSGPRPISSGLGWTKPGTVALQEKEGLAGGGDHVNDGIDQGLNTGDGVNRGSGGVYLPPSARSVVALPTSWPTASAQDFPPLDKATVLRGEDFPSLQAALPVVSGAEKKQKDGLNQKQKQLAIEELSNERRDGSRSSSVIDMRPQLQLGRIAVGNELSENGSEGRGLSGSRFLEQGRKRDEYFLGPLPLVRLNPISDWADDERDTGQGFTDCARDHGYSKTDAYWDRDFDMPRAGVLPHKPAHSLFDRWGQRDDETERTHSSEAAKLDPYVRDAMIRSREGRDGNAWRPSSTLPREGIGSQEIASESNSSVARPLSMNREKENEYNPSSWDNAWDDTGRRDVSYGIGGRQTWNNTTDPFSSRGTERTAREHFGNKHYNRYKGDDAFQNSSLSKSSFPLGGKGLPVNDPIINFGREKRLWSKNEKPYVEDPLMKDFGAPGFDGRDPFPGNLVGVVKRKKDMLKQTVFHDPVRESFEAELERVQKMQEQERQRIIEEKERSLEQARREEEERLQLAREQEEQHRRLEDEAREAARRAEHEQLEALRRAEEQRIAREEEKHRSLMEEERRKQAAKQKLLELEERIAKRQAESAKGGGNFSAGTNEKISGTKERDALKAADVGDWEDVERVEERITTSASSDSSGLNRPFEMTSKARLSNASSAFSDRSEAFNSWRRDVFENGNNSAFAGQETENGHHSPRHDVSIGDRPFLRKEFYGPPPYMSSRPYYRAGVSEPHMDDFGQPKGQRWNVSGDVDHYERNAEIESEYHENLAENYDDVTQGQHSRGNIYPPYPVRFYHNPEGDGLYSFGRSRYSVRQPRVLPPPTLSVMPKTSYRDENERPGPSTFLENEIQYTHATRGGSCMEIANDSVHQDDLRQHGIIDTQPENTDNKMLKVDGSEEKCDLLSSLSVSSPPDSPIHLSHDEERCDLLSSLSVSSPPDSPIHLSHDDLDECGDSAVLSAKEGEEVDLSGQGIKRLVLPTEAGKENVQTSLSSLSAGDDEEWTAESNEQLQEQEEYEEDGDGYQEEDEVHEGDDGNINLTQEFDEMHLEDKESLNMMDNSVLGFSEEVEVGMPNDEFETSSRKEVSAITQISVGSIEEKLSSDEIHSYRKTLQSIGASSQGSLDSSSRVFSETEKAMQDLVNQPNSVPQASIASELKDDIDAIGSTGVLAKHSLLYSVSMASHSSSVQSGMPTACNQAETLVKLQFGLFTGPSLIPSPVPAIQIGSIQMPLHLHPQGVLPLAPQSVSFVQPNVPVNFPLNRNCGVSLPLQCSQDTSAHNLMKNEVSSLLDNQSDLPRSLDLSHGNVLKEECSMLARESRKSVVTQHSHVDITNIGDNKARSELSFPSENSGQRSSVHRNFKALSIKQSECELPSVQASYQSVSKEKDLVGLRGQTYSNRGKKISFKVKGSNTRPDFLASESSHQESAGYRRRAQRTRTEFRIKESSDKKQYSGMVSSNHLNEVGLDEKSNANGRSTGFSKRNGVRKVVLVNKSKQAIESECFTTSALGSSREIDSESRSDKELGKEVLMRSQNIPYSGEVNLERNIEEDVDAPLQSGIVCVFKQPGIEAASNEDDFIEVRSKRQMLNDRREQREKLIRAKSRVAKPLRKPCLIPQSSTISARSNRNSTSASGEGMNKVCSDFVAIKGCNLANNEVSAGFGATIVSQPLAPIGNLAIKTDAQADIRTQAVKSLQTSSLRVASGGGPNLVAGFIFESKNKVLDDVQTSLGSWGNSLINQQVMTLTQTQLDDAMKPVQFDNCAPIGGRTSSVTDPSMPSLSTLLKDKSFSSAASPINSLLAGEKIQFGAVTSPRVLLPGSHTVSRGIGPPGPSQSEIQSPLKISTAENDCTPFFERERHLNESCVHLEDCEAEAEAAASAVAVAAITSYEIVGNGMSTGTISLSDKKGFGGADVGVMTTGDGGQELASQSKAEESLSVSLPADLSVENSPISLWPPLPSPQNSSSQMISHFPGGAPSHFPFYEMNPIMGAPIFAFGPHDESSSAQSQSQKSSTPASGPLGTWSQCHSGVDSFYGPPTGFTGHFITPPGGIHGVQGPPHMVVYNHFAPVGQFGLGFMGTTYIPSGKQPDWKHNPASAIGEGYVNNLNVAASQRNSTNMPAQIQHPAPGPASPLAMFDVSPFQTTPDMSVQACWSHIPASLQSATPSMPLQQQAEGILLPSQFSQGPHVDPSLTNNTYSSRKFPVATDAYITQLPDELGLVETSCSTISTASTHVAKSSSLTTVADAGKTDVKKGGGIKSSVQSKAQYSQQYSNSPGNNHQRGSRASQKNSSGEWTRHRMGFQDRKQSIGGDKNFPASKTKQIYVARQTTNATLTSLS